MPSRSQPGTFSRRTFAPVASSALSKPTSSFVESLTTRSPASSDRALVRLSSSMFCSPHHSSGLKRDRKSTRLNSSHVEISYAVFCLKKKKKKKQNIKLYCKYLNTYLHILES